MTLFAPSRVPGIAHAVQATPEFHRVVNLPRRTWSEAEMQEVADRLTAILRTPNGTMSLRPIQATALAEAGTFNGLFAPIRTGGGKTLLSLLVFYVMGAKRPLLLVPAKLLAKTQRDMRLLAAHWKIPNFIRIVSYEIMGRIQSAELLEQYQPDVIAGDEIHRLKNTRAAVTKRVMRYLAEHPYTGGNVSGRIECRFVAMSGTVTRKSLKDYAHLIRRCVANTPLPRSFTELEEWSDALDEKKGGNATGTGVLIALCNAEEAALHRTNPLEACRKAFRRRLVETEGVVSTTEAYTGPSLSIQGLAPKMNHATDLAFAKLRNDWVLPDDTPLADGLSLWRHSRELGLGFFYKWDPPAPPEWLAKRKAWCATCRAILGFNRRNLDSELQVTNAVVEGLYDDVSIRLGTQRISAPGALEEWRAIKASFEPKTVPVWFDDAAILECARWAKEGPGIIWTEHTAFAERLSEITGLAYFGKKGVDRRGLPIEDADPSTCLIASLASNSEGRNLQPWNRNLITSIPASGSAWEQLIGRTHRDGQEADEVSFEVITTCREHGDAFDQALADARYIQASTGQAQKVLFADVTMPKGTELR